MNGLSTFTDEERDLIFLNWSTPSSELEKYFPLRSAADIDRQKEMMRKVMINLVSKASLIPKYSAYRARMDALISNDIKCSVCGKLTRRSKMSEGWCCFKGEWFCEDHSHQCEEVAHEATKNVSPGLYRKYIRPIEGVAQIEVGCKDKTENAIAMF